MTGMMMIAVEATVSVCVEVLQHHQDLHHQEQQSPPELLHQGTLSQCQAVLEQGPRVHQVEVFRHHLQLHQEEVCSHRLQLLRDLTH